MKAIINMIIQLTSNCIMIGMTAPRAGGAAVVRSNSNIKQPSKVDEDDDFGDTDVSDLLG